MKGLIALVIVIVFAGVLQECNAQSTWGFKTTEPNQPEYSSADFSSAGLINSGLNAIGKEPEKRTARIDFSLQMQLPASK